MNRHQRLPLLENRYRIPGAEELWDGDRGPDCHSPNSPKICPQGSTEHVERAFNTRVVELGQDGDLLATTSTTTGHPQPRGERGQLWGPTHVPWGHSLSQGSGKACTELLLFKERSKSFNQALNSQSPLMLFLVIL